MKYNSPIISIIVPIYNTEKYLDECLLSIINQTYSNYEVIMVNDGSTDRSPSIAMDYVRKDCRFRLINKENGGLSSARNCGIDTATGKYICFLDSDDYYVDKALEIMVSEINSFSLDIVKFSAYTFGDDKKELIFSNYKYCNTYDGIKSGIELLSKMVGKDEKVSSCLMLVDRNLLIENHIRFPAGIIHEDNLFHLQLLLASKRVKIINEPLYCRREHDGSITTSANKLKRCRGLIVSAKEAQKLFDLGDSHKNRVIRRWIKSYLKNARVIFLSADEEERQSLYGLELYNSMKTIILASNYWFDLGLMTFAVSQSFGSRFEQISIFVSQKINNLVKKGK